MRLRDEDRRPIACIVLAGVLAYALCVGGGFVYDDLHSVRDNSALTSLANVPRYFTDVGAFSSLDCRLYRPVLLTTYAVDAAVSGMHPWSFKLTNLLLHIAAALLTFGIAKRLSVHRTAALVGACLFVVHPMASEAVNTVSGRSNILMVVGLLAAVRFHLAAMDGRRLAVLGTVASGMVSMGAKEPGMILPVLLVILEVLRRRSSSRMGSGSREVFSAAVRVVPVVVLVAGYIALRSHLLGTSSFALNRWEGQAFHSGFGRGTATQLATMAVLLPCVCAQLVVPLGLTMDPVVPFTSDLLSVPVLVGSVFLGALTFFGLRAPRRRPVVFFGTCLAWGAAAPWVLKPLNLPFLEHRMYGSLAGLAFVAAASFPKKPWPQLPRPFRIGIVSLLSAFAVLSATRTLDFRSERHLWDVELARNPESRLAMAGRAVVHMREEEYAAARPYLEELVASYPTRRDARLNLAEAALHLDDPEAALEQSTYLVEHWEQNPFHWLLHSRTLAALGLRTGVTTHFDAAVEAALHCLEIAPPKGLPYRTAASARRLQGDLDRALRLLDQSVARGLDHSSVLLDRSALWLAKGETERARADLFLAQRKDPFNPRVLLALQDLRRATPPK